MKLNKIKEFCILKFYRFINKILNTFLTFSADGEDIIIRKLFSGLNEGFYLDIGANTYKLGSNTFYFYLHGWSGVCIDPLPNLKKTYLRHRSRDIFLESAIVHNKFNSINQKNFYFFEDYPDNSTISKKRLDNLKNKFGRSPSKTIRVDTISISDIIKKYKNNKEIHFLNLDIEGGEFDIIEDLVNLNVFPWVICVEEIGESADSIINNSKIYKILIKNSYVLMSRTFLSSIYVSKEALTKLTSPYLKDFDK